jgi:long-subunit fatty acid transport protein
MFSRKPTRLILLIILTAVLLLTSCNVGAAPAPTIDVNALSTALVGTTVAQLSVQLTQTALAAPTNTATPTATVTTLATSPLPTFSFVNTPVPGANTPVTGLTPVVVLPTPQATAALGDACNNNVFEGDVTIPDGTILKPGINFVKQWAIRNTGNCTWDDGYALIYIAGTTPDLDPRNFQFKKPEDFVSPGESINIGIPLTTPCKPGKYEGHWRMQSDSGYYFGTILSVYVEVKEKC